mmetsp:Transcript_14493/g.29696  ORF Transcript_14493/g.29696 Transcript_14493/m.29696 type:complete len:87 (+) Transcript_14493:83-343(+)
MNFIPYHHLPSCTARVLYDDHDCKQSYEVNHKRSFLSAAIRSCISCIFLALSSLNSRAASIFLKSENPYPLYSDSTDPLGLYFLFP